MKKWTWNTMPTRHCVRRRADDDVRLHHLHDEMLQDAEMDGDEQGIVLSISPKMQI